MNWIALVTLVCGTAATPNLPTQIEAVAQEFNVDKTLILSVIFQESRCKPDAVGTSNDSGLMQIVPRWHQERIERLSVTNLFDPKQNMRVGADILSSLNVNGSTLDALVVYNGGYARPESSYNYARQVIQRKANYDSLLGVTLQP